MHMTADQPAVHAPEPTSRLDHRVLVADRVSHRSRRAHDAFDLLLSIVSIGLVLLIGVYAHGTTSGMTEDVRTAFGGILRQILLLPITLFESIFVLAAPIVVIVALAMRKRLRQILEAIGAGLVTAVLMSLIIYLSFELPDLIAAPLTVSTVVGSYVVLDALMATLAAFLTVAGEANQMRTVRYSWFFLFLLSFIYVLRGSMTLPSALISLLIGRAVGSGTRYMFGFRDDRGGAVDLVDGLLHIGIIPDRIVRADLDTSTQPLEITYVTEDRNSPTSVWSSAYYPLIEIDEDAAEPDLPTIDINALPTVSAETDRHYICWDKNGQQYDLIVLDPDTQITALAHDMWNNIRLKGLGRWVSYSLQATAERSALVKIAAHDAGVMTPEIIGVTAAGGSVFTVQESVTDAQYLDELPVERLTDDVLDRFYTELKRAHRRGIAHRSISTRSLALDSGDRTWLINWDEGQVATSNLNRRIDVAQMIMALAQKVGKDRALASARRVFGEHAVQLSGPALQRAILPPETTRLIQRGDNLLADLRQAMIGPIPDQEVPEIALTRFQLKTVIMAIIGVVALGVVFGSLNFENVVEAVQNANPWWILASFGLGLLTYVGAALPLAYFVPEKLKLGETIMVQVAASVVTLVAPAGIGPAALNLRYLNKRGTSTPLALATVALVQFTQFVTTVITLLLVVLITGRSTVLELPSNTVLYAVGLVTLILGGALTIPRVRQEIWKRLEPTWNQIWQRLIWVMGQPKRLLIGIAGNLLMTISFIAAFGAALAAFGYSLDPTTLAITYLASNSLGSVIPAPGGIGPVEAALTAGLTVAGIPSGVAISTALVYRLVTFYGRAPLGWIALRIMQKRDLI